MKLAYHGATHMPSDLVTDVLASERAGFQALEVWAAKVDRYLEEHSPRELARLFADHGLEIVSINSIEFIGFRGEQYSQIRARCRALANLAETIGCGTLVVVPSPTPRDEGSQVLSLGLPWETVVAEYVTVLRDLSAIAEPHGVRLAFEFLAFGWCSVRTPRGAAEIVRQADRPNVGVNVDACHFYGGGGEMDEISALDPARIYTFHLNDMEDVPKEAITDARRLLPGEGVIPLSEICRRMHGIGYDGVCAVELFRPEYWARDPFELAAQARSAALKVLSPYFQVS
jgi:2-keto-myo-inositol isomerase